MQPLEIHGEPVIPLPEKLIHLPARKTLLVADTHFGKAATFRQAGLPVPGGTTSAMLQTLSEVIERQQAERLVILGDFVHSATRSETGFESGLLDWRRRHDRLRLTLVPGNHDRGHDSLFEALEMEITTEPLLEPPFAFCHFHQANRDPAYYTFAGHVHPLVRFREFGNAWSRLACFAFAGNHALLPAFGAFTGGEVIAQKKFDHLYVVADGEVVELKIKNVRQLKSSR